MSWPPRLMQEMSENLCPGEVQGSAICAPPWAISSKQRRIWTAWTLDTFDEVVRKAVKSTQKVERLQRTAETDYGDRRGPFRLIWARRQPLRAPRPPAQQDVTWKTCCCTLIQQWPLACMHEQPVIEVTHQPVGSFQVMKVTPAENLKETFSRGMESIVRTSFSGQLAFALWLAHYGIQGAAAGGRDGVYRATKKSCYHRCVWQILWGISALLINYRRWWLVFDKFHMYVCPQRGRSKWSDEPRRKWFSDEGCDWAL